jgi:hypothetical protein
VDFVDWRASLNAIVGSPAAEAARLREEEQRRLEEPLRIRTLGEQLVQMAFSDIWRDLEIAFRELERKDIGASISRSPAREWISIEARLHTLRFDLDIQNTKVLVALDGQPTALAFDSGRQYLVDEGAQAGNQASPKDFTNSLLEHFLMKVAGS